MMDNLQVFRDGNDLPLTISCPLCGYNNGKSIRRAKLEESVKNCVIQDRIVC